MPGPGLVVITVPAATEVELSWMLVTLNPAAPRVAEAPARSSPATLGTVTWATPLDTVRTMVEPLSCWVPAAGF